MGKVILFLLLFKTVAVDFAFSNQTKVVKFIK